MFGGLLFPPMAWGRSACLPAAVLFLLRQKKYPKKGDLRETAFLLKISSFDFSFEAQSRGIFRLPPE